MYQYDDFLAEACARGRETKRIVLNDLVPIGRIVREGDACTVRISADGVRFSEAGGDAQGVTARYLEVSCEGGCVVKFFVGAGYWASADGPYTAAMKRLAGWTGGDGVNSFNLADGNDGYAANTDKSLFIFGDTFVGNVDSRSNARIQPVVMTNNSYALMGRSPREISFHIPSGAGGNPASILAPKGVRPGEEWFWLQDGVVLNEKLFLTPLRIRPDSGKPEGFQFQVAGVSLAKIPIRGGTPDFADASVAPTGLYRNVRGTQYVGGASYMPYVPALGYPDGDGFIYAYGYISPREEPRNCRLIVARTAPERFADAESWKFYDGGSFVSGIENSAPILAHVSCEMSVTPIVAGANSGKFLAVFQYDVQSDYVAYAVGESPWGPFGSIRLAYECDERRRIDAEVYVYNAKAHPHLSTPGSILVSYNVNTPSMEKNYNTADIYRPRFIRLHDTTIKEE